MKSYKKYIRHALKKYKGNELNEIETAIVTGAITANYKHEAMSGLWLDSAPESFLNTHIGIAMLDIKHEAYVDTSFKRMRDDLDWIRIGRPPKTLSQRPDITVIKQSEETIKAIIETKIAYTTTGPKKDIGKLQNYLKGNNFPKFGYLFVYSFGNSKKGPEQAKKLLENKLCNWNSTEARLRMLYVCPDTDDDYYDDCTHAWGIALYKVPRPKKTE